jgi:hypothetical protein
MAHILPLQPAREALDNHEIPSDIPNGATLARFKSYSPTDNSRLFILRKQ